ncbi:MAG: hypothetical protein KIT84_13215 [Labilithrix sp.]|nr:hypothetical protein [Labilithrix sp.]MCW5811976.1 hypothetical protein [Labilithrix sp.]
MIRSALVVAVFASITVLSAACDGDDVIGGTSCTEAACNDGVLIDFEYREPGAYAFDVTVDGVTTTCTATLPLPPSETDDPCAAQGIYLTRTGAALSADMHSLGGIRLASTSAQNVTLEVRRDDQPIADRTFAVQYSVTPGPNGPDCEPKECRLAQVSLAPATQ